MKIVSLQLEVGDRPKAENVAGALEMVKNAPEADLILLPEIWPIGFFSFDRYHQEAETIDGPTVKAFRAKAIERQCHIPDSWDEQPAGPGERAGGRFRTTRNPQFVHPFRLR